MSVHQTLTQLYGHATAGQLPSGDALKVMQRSYPGEYVLEEYFDPKSMRFAFRPKFTDTRKEMLWKIQYGY